MPLERPCGGRALGADVFTRRPESNIAGDLPGVAQRRVQAANALVVFLISIANSLADAGAAFVLENPKSVYFVVRTRWWD